MSPNFPEPRLANLRAADHPFEGDSVNSQNEKSYKEHPSSQVTAESSSDSIARVCYRAIRDRDDLKTIREHAHLHRNHSSQSAVPTESLLY
jgi:hypothetical protein